jgi:hypothetical protein
MALVFICYSTVFAIDIGKLNDPISHPFLDKFPSTRMGFKAPLILFLVTMPS